MYNSDNNHQPQIHQLPCVYVQHSQIQHILDPSLMKVIMSDNDGMKLTKFHSQCEISLIDRYLWRLCFSAQAAALKAASATCYCVHLPNSSLN